MVSNLFFDGVTVKTGNSVDMALGKPKSGDPYFLLLLLLLLILINQL